MKKDDPNDPFIMINNMQILHIINSASYIITESYIKFIHANFNTAKHKFIVLGKIREGSPGAVPKQLENTLYFSHYLRNIIQILINFYRADKLIFHSFFIHPLIELLLLLWPPFLKKTYWVAWGGDLYDQEKSGSGIKSILLNTLDFRLRKKVENFVGIFPADIKFYNQKYGTKARTFYAVYVGELYTQIYNKNIVIKSLPEKIRNGECIHIQVGHSCTPQVNHIEVLKDLEKYKDENIKIFLPLSYGNMEYGNEVARNAQYLFGEKAVCLREFMDKEKYMNFLSTIDIAIFNTQRQIGLGNISPLLYMEKKFYMPADSVMYEYYKSQGISICDYNKIKDMKFHEFIGPVDMKRAREFREANMGLSMEIEMWRKVFDAPPE